MHFIGCLLGLLLAVILVVLHIGLRLWWALREILGLGSPRSTSQRQWYQGQGSQQGSQGQDGYTSSGTGQQGPSSASADGKKKPGGKVFADNEGEYVDFEEVQ